MSSATKEVFCRQCDRRVRIPAENSEGHPYGWYYLTVGVPAWFNADSHRCYRPVGLFCSAQCLADASMKIAADEEIHRNAYEYE
jgi:hypothetical protein